MPFFLKFPMATAAFMQKIRSKCGKTQSYNIFKRNLYFVKDLNQLIHLQIEIN